MCFWSDSAGRTNINLLKIEFYILVYIAATPMRCLCSTQLCNKASVRSLQCGVFLSAILGYFLVIIKETLKTFDDHT